MNDYSQPDFYRFNEDSFELIRWVKNRVDQALNILDLGAGAGVIGIELSNHFSSERLTLLEMEKDFLPHLESNVKTMSRDETQTNVIVSTFGNWIPSEKYDLIVCNPPYFLKGQGRVSPDERKQRARTFEVDDWEILTKTIDTSLSPEGQAFVVVRSDEKLRAILGKRFKINTLGKLWILELSRLNVDRDENGF